MKQQRTNLRGITRRQFVAATCVPAVVVFSGAKMPHPLAQTIDSAPPEPSRGATLGFALANSMALDDYHVDFDHFFAVDDAQP